jgi:hexosaminidase
MLSCRTWPLLLQLLIAIGASGQSIIPAPVLQQWAEGHFIITPDTRVITGTSAEVRQVAQHLSARFERACSWPLALNEKGTGILLQLNAKPDTRLGSEGYTLRVTSTEIVLQANTAQGLFYGVQSLLQLLPKDIEHKSTAMQWRVPAVSIMDYPRFAWRGLMLDVSRHFFTIVQVKEYIDWMARYKFNRFHWHLTDDNGWRIEIKSFPKLTSVGAWRVPRTGTFNTHTPPKPGEAATYGGYYTQDDIREVVRYAKERFIDILPEVDVPGHSMAALAAYPELSVTNQVVQVNPGTAFSTWHGNGKFDMHIDNTLDPTDERTYQFLDKVFGEVAALFPFEYIHMGGDECYKGYWLRDARVQAFMKDNNLATGEALQAYFNKRVAKIIAAKKKKVMGWDEILEGGLADGAAVMSWRGTKGGVEASHLKHPVVMSPAPVFYLDMMQGDAAVEARVYNTSRLKDVYAFDIVTPQMDSAWILGGQGNLWTEQIPTMAQADYMTYPRAWAISEGLWTTKTRKDWPDFVARTEQHFLRLEVAGKNFATALYDPIITATTNTDGLLVVQMETELAGIDIYYTLDNAIPNHLHPRYTGAFTLPEDADFFRCVTYRDGKPLGRQIKIAVPDLQKRVRN